MTQKRLLALPENWTKALAIAAHPDDMEYGAASAVARWTSQGKEVNYLLLTRGEAGIDSMSPDEVSPLREREEVESAAVVGVNNVEFLNHSDGILEYGLPLRRDISRVIRKHQPEVIINGNHHLTFSGTKLNMADHRWASLAVLDAARDAGNRWIFPELLNEGYEPWGGVKMVFSSGSPSPSHGVDVSDFIDLGVESLRKHDIYLKNLAQDVDPNEMLRWNASISGESLGVDYAVAFEVIYI